MALTKQEYNFKSESPEEFVEKINDLEKTLNISSKDFDVILNAFMMDVEDVKKYIVFIENPENNMEDIIYYLSNIDTAQYTQTLDENLLTISKKIRARMEKDHINSLVQQKDELICKTKKRI